MKIEKYVMPCKIIISELASDKIEMVRKKGEVKVYENKMLSANNDNYYTKCNASCFCRGQ